MDSPGLERPPQGCTMDVRELYEYLVSRVASTGVGYFHVNLGGKTEFTLEEAELIAEDLLSCLRFGMSIIKSHHQGGNPDGGYAEALKL